MSFAERWLFDRGGNRCKVARSVRERNRSDLKCSTELKFAVEGIVLVSLSRVLGGSKNDFKRGLSIPKLNSQA